VPVALVNVKVCRVEELETVKDEAVVVASVAEPETRRLDDRVLGPVTVRLEIVEVASWVVPDTDRLAKVAAPCRVEGPVTVKLPVVVVASIAELPTDKEPLSAAELPVSRPEMVWVWVVRLFDDNSVNPATEAP
jgi:hypothetical protein